MNTRLALVVLVTLGCACLGCGAQVGSEPPRALRTEAQIDTAIARSDLPGAAVVDRALRVSGEQADRAAALDSSR